MSQSTLKRRFRFSRPQRIAAALLALFLAQCGWLATRQLSWTERSTAQCGGGVWGAMPAGVPCVAGSRLAALAAGTPVALGLIGRDADGQLHMPLAPWQSLLIRLPFLLAGAALGGGLWWVTRRQFGNWGGYTALGLYCFLPAAQRASATAGEAIFSALALYGGVYTCIGVAHAMQGPRRKWRPRIVLLSVIFTLAVWSQWTALGAIAALGLGFMLWIADGRRRLVVPVLAIPVAGALALAWSLAAMTGSSLAVSNGQDALWMAPLTHMGFLPVMAGALVLYAASRRSRFFGNTVPLIVLVAMLGLGTAGVLGAGLWALPFALTFLAGVAADAYEFGWGQRVRWAVAALLLVQAGLCLASLPGWL